MTPGLASAPTQEKKRNPPGSNNANMGSGEMLDVGGQVGRQTDDSPSPAAVLGCSSPHVTCEHWLSPPSSSSPGDTHQTRGLATGRQSHAPGPMQRPPLHQAPTYRAAPLQDFSAQELKPESREETPELFRGPTGTLHLSTSGHSWAVNKLLFTTQSRARRTISLRQLWQDLRFHLTPQCDYWRPQ